MGWLKNTLLFSLLAAILLMPISAKWCQGILIIYILCWIAEGQWGRKIEIVWRNPIIIFYLLFLALHLIGISYSEDGSNGWFNVEKKIFLFLLPIVIGTTLSLDKNSIQLLFKGFIAGCLVATLCCLALAFVHFQASAPQNNFDNSTLALFRQLNPGGGGWWMHFSYIELASGIGMHPTFLSLYLIFCILLILHLTKESTQTINPVTKAGIILLLLYFEFLIVLLSSRIIILSLIIIIIYVVIRQHEIKRTQVFRRGLVAMAAIVPLISILWFNPISHYRSIQEPARPETYAPSPNGIYEYSTGIRKSLWQLSIRSIKAENPLFGAGTGDVKMVMKKHGDEAGSYNILGSYDPHNQFMYTQLGLGMAGLAVLVTCFYFPAWLAFRQKKFLYLAFILTTTFTCFTESMLESQQGIIFFAIFNSLLVFPYYNLYSVSQQRMAYG